MSTDYLALVFYHLVMFQRDCLALSPFPLQAGLRMEILLEKHEEAFAVWKAVSARTPRLLHSSSASQPPCAPSLCVCSPTGGWQSEAGSFWMEEPLKATALVAMGDRGHHFGWYTPQRTSDLEGNLTESKQGLFLGGNVSRRWSLGGCRYQPQGAGWGQGSGTQNESGASGHLSSVDQRASSFRSEYLNYKYKMTEGTE